MQSLRIYLEGRVGQQTWRLSVRGLNILLQLIAKSSQSLSERAVERLSKGVELLGPQLSASAADLSYQAISVLVGIGREGWPVLWSWLEAHNPSSEEEWAAVLLLHENPELLLHAALRQLSALAQAAPDQANDVAWTVALRLMVVVLVRMVSSGSGTKYMSSSLAGNIARLLYSTVCPRRLQSYINGTARRDDQEMIILIIRIQRLMVQATPVVVGVETEPVKLVTILLAHFESFVQHSPAIVTELLNLLNFLLHRKLEGCEDPSELMGFRCVTGTTCELDICTLRLSFHNPFYINYSHMTHDLFTMQ